MVAEKERCGFEVLTKICPKCGLLMINPRMTQESYDKFYNEVYGKVYFDTEEPTEFMFDNIKKRGVILYKYLSQNCDVNKIKNVLEIGCSDGGILAGLISCGMKNCKGIDLNADFINFGKSKGLNLECCHSKELLSRNEKYDLIILSHVLEHFLDIKSELAVIRELLSDNGLFYVTVPGLRNLFPGGYYCQGNWLRYFQNANVRHFCRNTLTQVMGWNGFEEITASEEVRGIYKKSDFVDNKKCVNYFDEVFNHLKFVEERFNKTREFLDQEKNDKVGKIKLTHVTVPYSSNVGDTVLSYCVRRTFDKLNSDSKNFSYFLLHVRQRVTDYILSKLLILTAL